MNIKDLRKNRERINKFERQFFEIFRHSLSHFTDALFTFDVIKFDRQVIKSKERNDSPDNLVRKDFGVAGARLIRELLDLPLVKREKKVSKIRKIKKEKA